MAKKEIKKEKAIIILIFVILISIAITCLTYNYLKPSEIQTIDMYLTVGNYTGFDVNISALTFGTIAPTGSAKRTINITSIADKKQKVCIKAQGELKQWTTISEKTFILNKDESKEVEIKVKVPSTAEYRKYNGTLKISFR
jgi:hypothetical protein